METAPARLWLPEKNSNQINCLKCFLAFLRLRERAAGQATAAHLLLLIFPLDDGVGLMSEEAGSDKADLILEASAGRALLMCCC